MPFPAWAKAVIAVLQADDKGRGAIVFTANSPGRNPPLLIIDFDRFPLRASLFPDIRKRILALAAKCNTTDAFVFVPDNMRGHAAAAGLITVPIPPEFIHPEELLFSVAQHVGGGKVRICADAHERAQSAPFSGAMNFRAGEDTSDPLRAAAILAVALALDEHHPALR